MTTPAAELARLVAAFEEAQMRERPTLPILDELEAAGGAAELARSPDPGERRLAARIMELLPDEAHVSPLAALLRDADPAVAAAARDAFAGQPRTPEWHAVSQYDLPPHAQSP